MSDEKFTLNSDPVLSNAGVMSSANMPSFREGVPSTSTAIPPPVLPPRPDLGMSMQPSYGMGVGSMGSYGMGMGGYGMGMNGYGMGGYGGYGMGGMGGYGMGAGYGGRYGPMYGDIESRFIQMAEESSRPAFDSIQGVVHAVGSIAMMLENTFFALTSSFRAILGVAENFGRLRSLFAQFWSTFAVVRSINWLLRKLLVLMGIRTESEFKAWAQAVAATQAGSGTPEQKSKGSSWPILLFFGVVTAAPYIVLKMLSGMANSVHERLNDPTTWQTPLRAVAQFAFQATSPQELNFSADQVIHLAPQHLQGALWNSGWLMGSVDRKTSGLVPVSYIKVIRPMNSEGVNGKSVGNETSEVKPKSESSPGNEELGKYFKDL